MTRPFLLVAIGLFLMPDAGACQARPVSGDGGGLATFGDRGLTTFGDRGLASFSDIPLAPMGGLEVPGPSARRTERPPRPSRLRTSHPPRLVGPSDSSGSSLGRSAATSSVASLRGVTLPPSAARAMVVLPPVVLPAVTLDHRPALAALEQSLREEIARARQRGDADLVRSLATGMQALRMAAGRFRLVSSFKPSGDQPHAIETLARGIERGERHQVLLGITGSGKTFTMASVVERVQKPTLVLAHNKTLAAQLYSEFKSLFPDNAVEYFVSYYDYYQPEAYVPRTDTYIEKDASINQQIERMRNSATRSLLERRDVLIVASVSCIYGLGSPGSYAEMSVEIDRSKKIERDALLRRLTAIQYQRNNFEFQRGSFRVRGDVIEIFPAYEESKAIRVELFDDQVEALVAIDPLTGEILEEPDSVTIWPASHYVTPRDQLVRAREGIEAELALRLVELKGQGKLLEAQRLEQRTRFDLEMLQETGTCPGIENYSRHLDGRAAGEPPATLLNYFPEDFLLVVDESHQSIPQVGGMFRGDRARKETLVGYGFRLPSALDNRPLRFDEFDKLVHQVTYVSATPAQYERDKAGANVVEQILRPTGLLDPVVEIRPARGQVDDLHGEILKAVAAGERVLVTTLTKRMSEELTDYYRGLGVKVKYLHSDIDTIERTEILEQLREGGFDVLVGINLLREGLDLPEVALVGILDADKEGFLRSTTSLIQTFGRAARNVNGRAILYAEKQTDSIRAALGEVERRRAIQIEHNKKHGITPETVKKNLRSLLDLAEREEHAVLDMPAPPRPRTRKDRAMLRDEMAALRAKMLAAAEKLEFEKAAQLRDQLRALELDDLKLG